ncbi:IS110 family transposase [Microbacterium sp. OR21]|uniref:IS110 family transposase n=1 Tax=Microbacterium sp. OR21 TaxID=3095346 RepID=UPI0039B68C92
MRRLPRVVALASAGFTVYPTNPPALARYRERHGLAGQKPDPADAIALAHLLRTDLHLHRPLRQTVTVCCA